MNLQPCVLIIGGTSDIGRAAAMTYAAQGWDVMLAGRDVAGCRRNADDLAVRSACRPEVFELDILNTDRFAAFVGGLPQLPDTVICVVGVLGDQRRSETDPDHATLTIRSNFEGPALLLEAFAARMAARGDGVLVGVSSVAGDRGRSSNYIYGAAKGGFSTFLSGLRHRLASVGVCVITVKPGFVRTKMTRGLALPSWLTAEPAEVAQAIFSADRAKRPRALYIRRLWGPIMTIIRLLPDPLFLRTRL